MSPRLEAGFRIAARWRLFTEPAVGPWDGRSPSLSRASRRLLLGRRLEWTSPLGTRRSRSMLSSTASGPDFPGGRLRARYRRVPQRSSNEPGTVARLELGLGLEVLYRRAFPQSSSDPGLYSAFNSRRGSRTLASAITCCAMSVARSRRLLHIAISAQQGLEAPLRLSRGPQPLAPGHCPTCGFRRPRLGPSPPSTHCVCGRDF